MPTRRNNWYNLHSTRRFPLDDKSTGTDDDGARLKDDIITDLHLRYPEDLGEYPFLSGLTVTDRLVTAIIMVADDLDDPQNLIPLAAVHVTKPVAEGVNISLRPLQPQVGGFIVFGDTSESFVGRFSTPRQGLIAPRAARSFNRLPIPTVRRATNAAGLQGLVTLRGQSDVEVVRENVAINGIGVVRALVVRLSQLPLRDNVLEKYIGPCGARPESRNCEKTPIETINGAVPDCDGNINIHFCRVDVAQFSSCGGLLIDGDIGIDEVCSTIVPEQFKGTDQCEPSMSSSSLSSLSSSSSSSSASADTPPAESSSGGEGGDCASLPYCESFDDSVADYFAVKIGSYSFVPLDSPDSFLCEDVQSLESSNVSSLSSLVSLSSSSSDGVVDYVDTVFTTQTNVTVFVENDPVSYRCNAAFQRNVAVWDACAHNSSLDKQIYTDLRLNAGPEENGGVVVNWHIVDPLTNPHEEYYHALLDRKENAVRLMRYGGISPIVEIARASLGEAVVLGHWYRMRVRTSLLSGSTVVIQVVVSGVTDPGWPQVTLTVPTTNYLPDDGLFGLGSIRGVADFSYFSIEETP